MRVREKFLPITKATVHSMTHLSNEIEQFVKEFNGDDEKALMVMISCWDQYTADVADPMTWMHNKDKRLVNQLKTIEFDANIEVMRSTDQIDYLRVIHETKVLFWRVNVH